MAACSSAGHGATVPRPPRIDAPGRFWHVFPRGNNGETIARDSLDLLSLCALVERVTLRQNWTLFTYCLMTNHFHLVLRSNDGNISAGMQILNRGHAQLANKRHGRTGHLFRNRFGAEVIETDEYLREACRYVVLNPVRAGIVRDPADWHWCSFRATIGLERAPAFVDVRELLGLFGSEVGRAQEAFRQFVAEGIAAPRHPEA
jgi:REP element-mobilizing transposase RayT